MSTSPSSTPPLASTSYVGRPTPSPSPLPHHSASTATSTSPQDSHYLHPQPRRPSQASTRSHSSSTSSSTSSSPPLSPSPSPSPSPQPNSFLVRALHSFSPSSLSAGPTSAPGDAGQANSCLAFEAGDVIRCLNMDESGWWDGELLAPLGEGAAGAGARTRGWFPRNYVQVLDENQEGEALAAAAAAATSAAAAAVAARSQPKQHQLSSQARALLSSIEHNVGLLDNAVRAGRKGHYQPSTACVISSIRTVLSATSSLTRDSPILRAHPTLSSARKKILSSLASLVNQARKASAPSLPLPPDRSDTGEIGEAERRDAEEMMKIARGTVECVKGFLVKAEERGVEVDPSLGAAGQAASSSAGTEAVGLGVSGTSSGGGRDLRAAKSMGNLRERRPTLEALQLPSAGKAGSTFPVRNGSSSTIKAVPTTASSVRAPSPSPSIATSAASSAYTTPFDASPSTNRRPSSSISISNTLTLRTPSALSSHLSNLHDSLLSTLAALIGHVHSHSRSSSPASSFAQLIDLTRESIERVRDCLVVVEKVGAEVVRREVANGKKDTEPPSEEMKVLAGARERLYEATTALVSAARIATTTHPSSSPSPSPSTDPSPAVSPANSPARSRTTGGGGGVTKAQREQDEEERKTLLAAATGVLRAGGDCVGAVKLVVPSLGAGVGAGGAEWSVVLPRPKTSEELAEEAAVAAGQGGDGDGDERGSVRSRSRMNGAMASPLSEDDDEARYAERVTDKFADAASGDEREILSSPQPPAVDSFDAPTSSSKPQRPRNPHTLSMLGRKATSLGNLRGRFEAELKLEEEEGDEGGEGEERAQAEKGRRRGGGESTSPSSSPPQERLKNPSGAALSPTYTSSTSQQQRTHSPSHSASSSAGSMALYSPPPPPTPGSATTTTTTTTTTTSTRPSSIPMNRNFSSGSGHSVRSTRSGVSSRATAASTTSTVASAQTADTSPRNSFQTKRSTRPGSGGPGVRTSLGSVREWEGQASPPLPIAPGSASASSSSPSHLLLPPRSSTPEGQQRKNSTLGPMPISPASKERRSSANGGNIPWFLERDYPPREVSFNADGHVSGGTLRCLVERMTLHDTTIDAGFSNTFFLTFRMFTTPSELATLLFARFDLSPPEKNPNDASGAPLSPDELKQWTASKLTPIRLRIYNFFKTWVEGYWLHDPDHEIVESLLEWCRGRLRAAMPSASQRLVDLVNKRVLVAERDAAAAAEANARSSYDGPSPTNASMTSLVSQSSTTASSSSAALGTNSMNSSTLSLALHPTISRQSGPGGLVGGNILHRMQSTDRLKAGKPLVPYSAGFSASNTATDSYFVSAANAAHAPPSVTTKSLLAHLRPTLSGRAPTIPSVVEIDVLELARQLTIMESRVYGSIRPDELLGSSGAGGGGGGGKGGGEGRNANVRKMSALSTRLTGWIAETILNEQDQKRRTGLVKYFVKLGERLLSLANYNALFAVFTALNSSTISRLKRTWDGLAPKYKASFEVLRKATDHARNYAEYRQKIRQAVPPCLPFVGLFLTDLIFIFEGNRAERPSPVDPSLRLINFDRYHKMARIVGELQRFQVPYVLAEVSEIQGYLNYQLEGLKNGQDAQSLYRQSLLIEPRQQTAPSSSAASVYSQDSRSNRHDMFSNWGNHRG